VLLKFIQSQNLEVKPLREFMVGITIGLMVRWGSLNQFGSFNFEFPKTKFL